MISVIIPIYNCSNTLVRCLQSLKEQTYTDIEVIMINDGSKDNSGDICKRFANMDSRYIYIEKENGGVSSARNKGLSIARGDYITFCDADDWADFDMIEHLYNLIKSTNSDISICSPYVDAIDKIGEKHSNDKFVTYNAQDAIIEIHKGQQFAGHPWGKLFAKNICDGLFFNEDITIFEDMVFVCEAVTRSNKVVFQDMSKYHYVMYENSAINKFKESFWSIQQACRVMVNFFKHFFPKSISWAEKTALVGNVLLARRLSESHKLSRDKYKSIKKEISLYNNNESVCKLSKHNILTMRIFLFSRHLFNAYICILKFRRKLKKKIM